MEFHNRYKKYKAKYLHLKLHGGHRYSDNGHTWIESDPKYITHRHQLAAIAEADRHYGTHNNNIYYYNSGTIIFSLIPSTDPRIYIMIRDDGTFAYLQKDETIDPARIETINPARVETINPARVEEMTGIIKNLTFIQDVDTQNMYSSPNKEYIYSNSDKNYHSTALAELIRGLGDFYRVESPSYISNTDDFCGIILLTSRTDENIKLIKLIPGGGNLKFTSDMIRDLMTTSVETLVRLGITPTNISKRVGRHPGPTISNLVEWQKN